MIFVPKNLHRITEKWTPSELEEWGQKQLQRKRDAIHAPKLVAELGISLRTFERCKSAGIAPPSLEKGRRRAYPPSETRAWLLDMVESQTDPAVFAKLKTAFTEDMPLELLNQKRAAETIGVSPRTMKRRAEKGSGPVSVRIGQGVYYPSAFLAIWLAQNPRQNGGTK